MSSGLLDEIASGNTPLFVPLTVDQLEHMIRAQVISEDKPIELIDGLLVYKDRSGAGEDPMVVNPRHSIVVSLLVQALSGWTQSIGHHIRVQAPVRLTGFSQPEPDVALLPGDPRTLGNRQPGPGDLAAVFEVSHSSLGRDRTVKHRMYASAGIPVYWILNLVNNQIEVYEHPTPGSSKYGQSQIYTGDEIITLAVSDEVLELRTGSLLG